MKKYLAIIFTLITFLISNCDSDSPVSTYDDQLKREIVGIWTDNEGYTVEFYNDGFFRDTIGMTSSLNDSAIVVRNGKYNINNSILAQTDFTFEYVYLANLSGVGIKAVEFKILINNGIMQRQVLESFDNIFKSNKNIWGDWFKKYYFCQYSTDSTYINGPFYGEEHYLFIQDSVKFRQIRQYEYPFSNVDTAWIDYTYTEPYLNIPAFSYYNLNVKFEDEKMICYFDYELNDLIKVH